MTADSVWLHQSWRVDPGTLNGLQNSKNNQQISSAKNFWPLKNDILNNQNATFNNFHWITQKLKIEFINFLHEFHSSSAAAECGYPIYTRRLYIYI